MRSRTDWGPSGQFGRREIDDRLPAHRRRTARHVGSLSGPDPRGPRGSGGARHLGRAGARPPRRARRGGRGSETFDAWIATPERERLTASEVHQAVDYRPLTRYDMVGGYLNLAGLAQTMPDTPTPTAKEETS